MLSPEIIGSPETAQREAKSLQEYGIDLTIFNYAIWRYPRASLMPADHVPLQWRYAPVVKRSGTVLDDSSRNHQPFAHGSTPPSPKCL